MTPTDADNTVLPKLAFLNFQSSLIYYSGIIFIFYCISVIKINYATINPPPITANNRFDTILLALDGI